LKRLAIFASGSGTNAEKIMQFFKDHSSGMVSLVLSNKKDAKVLERAARFGVPIRVFDRHEFYETDRILELLLNMKIDLIILAGFLWLVPENLIEAFPNRIINIHPALLPKYGGKGMYGARVHEAVIEAGDEESGITIHYVNPRYDEGKIIFQVKCKVEPEDDADSLAMKIHQLEYDYFPKVIENLIIK
jgi:phosphoribosylglycinamide formyltransferase-1